MIIETLKFLYNRDINKLKAEIEAYQNEGNLWRIEKGVTNSAGNLCLHLIGNLNCYIGEEIGKSGYVRDRDLEFSTKNVLRSELLQKIDETLEAVENALNSMTEEQLEAEYPIIVFEDKMTTGYFLIHLTSHLTYHLGQINYHRRLLDE
jgi:uncharacterized damage-inducible protein DinB